MKGIQKVLIFAAVLCLSVLVLAACASNSPAPASSAAESSAEESGAVESSADEEEASTGESEPAAEETATTQTVADLKGVQVEVPTQIDSIVDLWHAHNQVVLMLGAGDKLVGTTENFKAMEWANVVYPRLAEVEALVVGSGAGEVNYEEALSLEPSVVFASDDEVTETARKQGMATLNVGFSDYDGLREDVRVTGQVLGGEAQERAAQWEELLDKNIALVAERMKDVDDGNKVRVLHLGTASNFTMVDGTNTIIDEWIKLAGGVNAIEQEGNRLEITMEEIIAADPDVIIIGSATPEDVEALKADEGYSGMRAVQNGAVYANPNGVFPWDRYSGEEALQVLWAAKFFNPDLFEDIDMVAETQDFYKTFYGYDLSEDEASRILNGEHPEEASLQAAA